MNFLRGLLAVSEDDLTNAINAVNSVVSIALGIVTTGVVILAIFIAYKFFTADDDSKRKNAKAQLIYAIIGVIVLLALLILTPTITSALTSALKTDSSSMFKLVF